MTEVWFSTHLRHYTGGPTVQAEGATLAALVRTLDERFPGIAFRIVDEQERIREHIAIFVNDVKARSLDVSVRPTDRVMVVGAISGG